MQESHIVNMINARIRSDDTRIVSGSQRLDVVLVPNHGEYIGELRDNKNSDAGFSEIEQFPRQRNLPSANEMRRS